MTVLFSDVRGFTTISEGLDPKALSRLMNEYLTRDDRGDLPAPRHDRQVHGRRDHGVLGRAASDDADHAAHGVVAALDMQKDAARACTTDFAGRGWPPLNIGVGLNYRAYERRRHGLEDSAWPTP